MNSRVFLLASSLMLTFATPGLAKDAASYATPSSDVKASTDKVASDKTASDYVILKVGDEPVKKSEVETIWKSIFPGGNAPDFDTFDPKVKDNVLRGVASEHILIKEAEKTGIQNSPEVQARLDVIRRQLVIREYIKKKSKELVTDTTLKAAYANRIKNIPAGKEEVHARHILVKTESEARAIEKQLKKGANFETLAKEKSEDKSSGASGGDLGYFTEDKMVPQFSKVAFGLKKGEISEPVKTDFGWHIIQVEDRRKNMPPTFEQMKPALEQEENSKQVNAYVHGLMKDVKLTAIDASGKERNLPPAPEKADGKNNNAPK